MARFTLERLPRKPGDSKLTADFKRGCYWLKLFEFGSYTARKIMHSDGTQVEPAYGDFVRCDIVPSLHHEEQATTTKREEKQINRDFDKLCLLFLSGIQRV
jgi:hypothetical protein